MDVLVLERRAVAAIAGITVVTGAAQVVASAALLPVIAPSATPPAAHLFATVGMFMVLFGGATLHALRCSEALPVVLLWGALQKGLAAVLVAWGVVHGVFLLIALAVAVFDAASCLLYLDLRRREARAMSLRPVSIAPVVLEPVIRMPTAAATRSKGRA